MVGIHLDTNYIFCKLMKNQTKGNMITAYQKMVDRMKLLALGLKHHCLDNKCLAEFKACIAKNRITHELFPGLPPTQHCQMGYPNVQEPFCLHTQWSGQQISPLPVVPSCATSGTQLQHLTTEQGCTKSVHVCPCPRATQLHEMPICTSGMCGNGPRQTQEQTIRGGSSGHQFQHWDSNEASPMFPHLHRENQGNKNQ